jgi:hypothetical protein
MINDWQNYKELKQQLAKEQRVRLSIRFLWH